MVYVFDDSIYMYNVLGMTNYRNGEQVICCQRLVGGGGTGGGECGYRRATSGVPVMVKMLLYQCQYPGCDIQL